ncbi:MAG TPA: acyltransferase [Pararhizobium sp.]|nr:acyltransferase [Pararhizobium sp.]
MQNKKPTNLAALTSMRGIAAIMVVVYHYTGSFLPALQPDQFTGLISKSYLMVDLFFILSGFIMTHVYEEAFRDRVNWQDFRGFMTARLARIYPLHFVILVALILLQAAKFLLHELDLGAALGYAFGPRMGPWGLFLNLFMLQTTGLQPHPSWNGPAWSIGAEFFAYLLFPILCLFVMRMKGYQRLLGIAAAALGLFFISHDGTDLDLTNRFGLFRCLFEFGIGVLIYRYFPQIRLRTITNDILAVTAILAVLLALHLRVDDIFMPFAFAGLVLLLASNRGAVSRTLSSRPLFRLGEISYSIYMSHFFVLRLAEVLSLSVRDSAVGSDLGVFSSLLVLVTMIALVIALSLLLHFDVERPARNAVRRGIGELSLFRRSEPSFSAEAARDVAERIRAGRAGSAGSAERRGRSNEVADDVVGP